MPETTLTIVPIRNKKINLITLNESARFMLRCPLCIADHSKSKIFRSQMAFSRHTNNHDMSKDERNLLTRYVACYTRMVKLGMVLWLPDYRCIFPVCKFNKRITNSEASFFRNHLKEHHFISISNIALGTSNDIGLVVRVLELKSRVVLNAWSYLKVMMN